MLGALQGQSFMFSLGSFTSYPPSLALWLHTQIQEVTGFSNEVPDWWLPKTSHYMIQ